MKSFVLTICYLTGVFALFAQENSTENFCECSTNKTPVYSESLELEIIKNLEILDSIKENNFVDEHLISSESILFLSEISGIEGGINWGFFGPDGFTIDQLECWRKWYRNWRKFTIRCKDYRQIALKKIQLDPELFLQEFDWINTDSSIATNNYLEGKLDVKVENLVQIEVFIPNYDETESPYSWSLSTKLGKYIVKYLAQKYPVEKIVVNFSCYSKRKDHKLVELQVYYGID